MTISFAPLRQDAVLFLMDKTGIDYSICDFTGPQWLSVTARNDDGGILGVFICEFQVSFDGCVTCAINDPRFLSRRLLKAIFTALFSWAVRLTAMTRPENKAAIRILKHLNFQYEGYCRLGIEGKWDGLVFGMLRNECRWLQPRPAIEVSDPTDIRGTNAIAISDIAIGAVRSSDFQYLSGG